MASSILVLGAGRSSSSLISYLISHQEKWGISLSVGDLSEEVAALRTGNQARAFAFDISRQNESRAVIKKADLVISMLPPHLHLEVANLCLEEEKHLLTASYVSEAMSALHERALAKNLLFLNECGLDPGIDHMSAMKIMHQIKTKGGKLLSFESFTGGLIAPETDPENPWGYKFTWNPRNVVMAGQGTAKFLQKGHLKYISYAQLFKRTTPIEAAGPGQFEGYVNRDSLKYMDAYGLSDIGTMIRGTLRKKGFCSAWDVLVQLGCTDDSYAMENVQEMTHRDFIGAFLSGDPHLSTEENLCIQLGIDRYGEEIKKLTWSGFFEKEKIGLQAGTPAQILEYILNKKWKLKEDDRDWVVMWHRFIYSLNGKRYQVLASLSVQGENAVETAMAKTVGLPLALAARQLLQNKISARGVIIPVTSEFYDPILAELFHLGIELKEGWSELD